MVPKTCSQVISDVFGPFRGVKKISIFLTHFDVFLVPSNVKKSELGPRGVDIQSKTDVDREPVCSFIMSDHQNHVGTGPVTRRHRKVKCNV